MKGFPDLPPLWWLGSIVLIYLFKFVAPGLHVQSAVLGIVGWMVFAVALGLIGWSAVYFLRHRTPIEPHHTPKALIVGGPYRLSRNPIYLALVLLTLASAIGNGSVLGLCLAGALWWVLDRRFAAVEEAVLIDTFGDAARAYTQSTRRWI